MRYVALASIIRWLLFAAGVLLLVRGSGETWIVPLIEAGALICVVFYLGVFSYYFGSLRQRVDYAFALSIFYQALPIGASELVWALKVYLATVLLGLSVGGPEVGWFAINNAIPSLRSTTLSYAR